MAGVGKRKFPVLPAGTGAPGTLSGIGRGVTPCIQALLLECSAVFLRQTGEFPRTLKVAGWCQPTLRLPGITARIPGYW